MRLLGTYRTALKRRNLRPGSIDKRMSEVHRWCRHTGGGWRHPDREQLEQWLDDRDLGARSRYAAISHLHQFYTWCQREDIEVTDPTIRVERPRLPRRLPRPANRAVTDALIAQSPAPMSIMLALMADAGLRACEVAVLRWADVDLYASTMHVTGKGGHERVVGIPKRLELLLAGCDDIEGPVIGRTITACRVSQLVNAHLHANGISATGHQLRHLYATRMLTATGGNLLAVQQALGHASVSSTQIYAQVDPVLSLHAARDLG